MGSRTTLRGRLLLALVIAFLPLLALDGFLLRDQGTRLRDRVVDERRALVRTEAEAADSFITGNIRTLEALAQVPSITRPESGVVDTLLRAVTTADPAWLTVALSDSDGWNISSITTPPHSVNIADRDYFQGALAGHPAVGTAILTRALGAKSVLIAVPVRLASGGRAVLTGALSLTDAEAELRRALPKEVELVIADRRGQQFIGPGIGESFPILTGSPPVDAALRGETDASVFTVGGREQLVAYAPASGAGWAIVLREPTSSAFGVIDSARATAIVVIGAATLVALLIAFYLGLRLEATDRTVEATRARADRERSAFFDTASHEIKTPLTALLGHVQLARRRAKQGAWDKVDDLLARAEQGGLRLAELVRDLLDVSRIEEGALLLASEPVDLAALVAGVVDDVRLSAEGHTISLDRGTHPLVVPADPRRVTQIVQNLLDNAVRYSPNGGTIDVRVAREDGDAVVRVRDEGLGIPEEDRGKLFERFFRSSRTLMYGGTGLGLFISRRIAEMHGGRLELEATGPGGSTFVLRMPAPPAADAVDADVARSPA